MEMDTAITDIMVGFVGAGKMAQALCRGFISSGLIKPKQITMSDPHKNQISNIQPLGVNVTGSNIQAVGNTKLVFISVKPHVVKPVLDEIYDSITKDHIVVSIAAGVSLESLQNWLPARTRVIRVTPNTPALVQCGASVYCTGGYSQPQDGELVRTLLSSVGLVEEIPERLMDAANGVSGSGPAYMYLAVEALSDGGVKSGLPRALSTKLAAQMMMGTAKMVLESGEHPGQLKDNVCSPGGTTIAAVAELERLGFRSSLIHAVEASAERSKAMGLENQTNSASTSGRSRKPVEVAKMRAANN